MPTLTFTHFDVNIDFDGYNSPDGDPNGVTVPVITSNGFGDFSLTGSDSAPTVGVYFQYLQIGTVNFARLVNPLPPTANIIRVTVREPQTLQMDATAEATPNSPPDPDSTFLGIGGNMSKIVAPVQDHNDFGPLHLMFSESVSGIPSETILYNGSGIDYATLVATYGTRTLEARTNPLAAGPFGATTVFNLSYDGNWEMEIIYDEAPIPVTSGTIQVGGTRLPGYNVNIIGIGLDQVTEVLVSYTGEPTIDEPSGPALEFSVPFTIVDEELLFFPIEYSWWWWIPDREFEVTIIYAPGGDSLLIGTVELPDVSGVYLITQSAQQIALRHDSAYDRATESTVDVKIADPLVRTGFIG